MKGQHRTFRTTHGEFHQKHSLGQNFIEDEALLEELAELSGVGPEDNVLEIGPGFGTLTKALASRCKKIVSVEVDDTLIPILRVTLEHYPNAEIICGDALKLDLAALIRDKFGEESLRIAANLPYYITSELLNRFTESLPQARSIAVMVQKEVGEKLLAEPKEEGYGPLTLTLQYLYEIRIVREVPAACFNPPPKVDSCFVLMEKRDKLPYTVSDTEKLFGLFKVAFAMRRKTLANNLVNGYSISRDAAIELLNSCGIGEKARAEELSMEQFCMLCNRLSDIR